LQFIPSPDGRGNYFKKIRYRAGAYKESTFLNLMGTQLTNSGISFGLGLPLGRIKSIVNIGMEFGKRGSIENGLIKENYWRARFGITLSDIWFVKRKYD